MSSLFTKFLCNPGQVGAFCASSQALAVEMTRCIGMETAGTVVELGPGTGAITREIVEKHNGSIRVESRVGEGTLFVVTLPVDSGIGRAAEEAGV